MEAETRREIRSLLRKDTKFCCHYSERNEEVYFCDHQTGKSKLLVMDGCSRQEQMDSSDLGESDASEQAPNVTPQESVTMQSPTNEIPCDTEWEGPYNFELLADGYSSSKKTWLYSHVLKKLYIDVFQSLPLQFKVDNRGVNDVFHVRALPVYSVAQSMSLPVDRCPAHQDDDEKKGKMNKRHVVQCSDQNAIYEYDEVSKRYSVVVPLGTPPAGSDVTTLMYTMVCKTSCPGGMNRRPIMIIFTLEKNREVVGRRFLNIRICSCPKRDKQKEELPYQNKDGPQPGPGKRCERPLDVVTTPGLVTEKKPRYNCEETGDQQEVYQVKVYGKNRYIEVLRYLHMLETTEHVETKCEKALRRKEEYKVLMNSLKKPNAH